MEYTNMSKDEEDKIKRITNSITVSNIEPLSEISTEIKNITVNDAEILEQQKNNLSIFDDKVHMDFERKVQEYPITPNESFKSEELILSEYGNKVHQDLEDKVELDIKTKSNWKGINFNPFIMDESHNINLYSKGFVQSYPSRSQEDFDKLIEKTSKYYNTEISIENDDNDIMKAFRNSSYKRFLDKKQKIVTINDKIIKYTHCIPTNIVIIKLTWKQKLKLLLGLKVNAIVNTYLNNGKVELTVLKIEE